MVSDQSRLHLLVSDIEVYNELTDGLRRSRIEYEALREKPSALWRRRGVLSGTEIVVALGSAGVFTSVWEIIKALVNKHTSKEVTIAIGENSITVKGHRSHEEDELLENFYKQVINSQKRMHIKKSKKKNV